LEEKVKQSKARKIINVVLVFVIAFLLNAVWSAVIGVIYGIALIAKGVNVTDPQLLMQTLSQSISLLFFSSIYNVFAIGVVFLFWHFADRRSIKELGYGFTSKTMIQVACGALGAIAAIALVAAFGSAFGIISFQDYGTNTFATSKVFGSLLLGLFTFLMVGFGEETVYRAYIQKHLVEVAGKKLGLIIAALIFACAHLLTYGKLFDLVDVFFAGIILGYAYMLTESIYLPAVFHFMWDFLQVNFVRLQDYEYYKGPVLMLFRNNGDLIINGFNFGNKLELIFILVEVIILALMYVFRERVKGLSFYEKKEIEAGL
jgi:membrane protease YdiL (CAAX protease family)